MFIRTRNNTKIRVVQDGGNAAWRGLHHERIFRDRTNPFNTYNVDLYKRFRFRRDDIVYLCDIIGDDIDHPVPRKGFLPPLVQAMVALRYYASGSFQVVIGDTFGIDRSTVSRIIDRVSRAFDSRLNEFVRFPDQHISERCGLFGLHPRSHSSTIRNGGGVCEL
ncbi:hypothetical protein BaRGS_00020209 [Batillaria attramentaria]|uniref:Nuclease HARBI1 n=1 Tax=Batillaria attramentaria TaxID=370345 RepID=A0ABD0KNV4_9CAEN